jgi:hypothetical protein
MSTAYARKIPEAWLWKPGQSGNPAGRKPGSRNKLTEAFLHALQKDFEEHGIETIAKAREEDPVAYIKVISNLCPRELDVKRPLEDMDDAELGAAIEALRSFVSGAAGMRALGDGSQGEAERTPATALQALPEAK